MEIINSLLEGASHFFAGIIVWKVIFGLTIIISGIFNVACWILEAAAVWEALAHDKSEVRRFLFWEFEVRPVLEMVVILVGIIAIIAAALTVIYAQLFGMIVIGIIGIVLLSLMSKRVKNVAKAVFFLVLDMGIVLLVRSLIIGDGSSEAMMFGTSIIALLASVAITAMRGGKLVIEKGRYVFK